jgi:hypothetical protein
MIHSLHTRIAKLEQRRAAAAIRRQGERSKDPR